MPDQLTTLLRAGKTAEAEALAQERLAQTPEDPPTLLALAKIRLVEGRFAEADELWSRASAGGASFDGRLVEAALLAQKGQPHEARGVYSELLREEPGSAEAHFGLGFLALSAEDFAVAEEHLAQAVASDPGNASAHFHYASALSRTGKGALAVDHLQRSMEINPAYPPAYFVLAELLDAAGQPDQAIEALITGLEVFPGQPDLTAAVTNRLAARGEWRRAHELAFEAARANPDHPQAVANLARFLMSAQRFDDALGLVDRLERQGQAPVEAYLIKGMIYEQLAPPRWDEAEAAYRSAAEVDASDWSGPNNLGLAVLRQGNPDRLPEAAESFREAMRRNPDAPEPVVNLARSLAQGAGTPAESREVLATLEGRLDPQHPLFPEVERLEKELSVSGGRRRG